ncbi:MAG TPA: helix-turn-helix transcriptional regulator [Acetivibrio sp.]|nr:helix-turn-helix domain-containing protein [Clostridium sp.]HOQ37856.1 helix-turn-helix transcriptional regulator [Acetivibrio sp.]HPT89985.1 helix-turn-helix transcriptional regulator [Acetivibrio sp.]HQA59138.1 helix-turn-helix transcriptional regulator [Acetivibrio sp.]
MSFAAMLKQLREEKKLSQKDIANFLGITRQAVASYELAKREPDYDVLKKLADYFNVSIDYLLGRSSCRDPDAFTIGKNIDLIRGSLTYKELSEDISNKLGALIFPDMLELYAKGERVPFAGTIKILAKYAQVRDDFFYRPNSPESYKKERELYKLEVSQQKITETYNQTSSLMDFIKDDGIRNWILNHDNLPYIKLAKEIQEAGLPVDVFKPLIESIKNTNKENED